jgi:thiol-disulfide isomerase/thioredoxin
MKLPDIFSGVREKTEGGKMKKTDLKPKVVSIVFVAVLLCAILAGVVSAESAATKSDAVNGTLYGNDSTSISNSCLNSSAPKSSANANNSLSSEIDRFLNVNKPVFLFFYADWCHFCQEQEPIIDELEQEYADNITFLRVNAKENLQPLNEFGVTGFPAMFLIVDKNKEGYVYHEFSGFTDKETLEVCFDFVVENGSLSESFECSCSSFRFNQTDFGNFSIVSQENLTLDAFKAELANDSEFKDLHDYARELGYSYPTVVRKTTFSNDISSTIAMINHNDSEFVILLRYSLDNRSFSMLTKIDNTSITFFDKDGGMVIDTLNGSISSWDTHQSCNVWKCRAACVPYKLGKSSESILQDLAGIIKDCVPGCGALCGTLGGATLTVCKVAFATTIPSGGTSLIVCGKFLLLLVGGCGGCIALNCGMDVVDLIGVTGGASIECWGECGDNPSLYGHKCTNDELSDPKCGYAYDAYFTAPGTKLEPDAVVRYKCVDCEWSEKEVIKMCTCEETSAGPRCKESDDSDVPPGGDKPDENYDVSTTRITLDVPFYPETAPKIAVLHKGFPTSIINLLASYHETATYVGVDFSQDLADNYPILIIPSGGLYGLDSLSTFKSNLEQYVENGGSLIVFSQQHGYEYNVLPGGNLSGFGWIEDQSCHHHSVYIDTYHPILSGQDSVTSDVTVDGYFTKYPENATILLSRTKNGMPAMLMYEYGNGTVIASTIYTDWASTHYQATQDGKNLVRDMIAWAKDRTEISEYGRSDTVNVSINVTNVHLPIPSVEYPQYEPGDAINISVNVTNYVNATSDKVSFEVFDPDYEIDYVNVSVSIPANETKIVNFSYSTTNESKRGTYFSLYSLYAGETLTGAGFVGGFALGVNTTNLSTYEVNFTLTTPDKKIIKQENISVYVPPGETKAVNFSYANPSTLGIWNLEYDVFDYNNTFIGSGTEQFAVSKYAENPDGFVYQGKDITFTVTSPEEQYAYGSDVPFTIHIYNHKDVARDISFSTHYKDWMLSTKLPEQNVEGSLEVMAGGDASFTHTLHVGDIYLSHNQLIIYASFSEDGSNLGRTEKVVYMFHPSVSVHVETDQEEYAKGEAVSVLHNLTNKRSASCNATVNVRTLDSDNNKVFEDTFNVNLSAYESLDKTLSFTMPTTAEYGTYIVTAEAFANGDKIGSGSTYFEVSKDYIVKINFDNPSKTYKVRESMNIDLEVTNIGSALWSSIINISIPDLAYENSSYVSLNPKETEKISYDLNIPENVTAGKHDVIVTIGFDSSVKQYYFIIPESNLVLSSDKTSYNAGDYLYFNLTNIGGVDTTCNCSIKFYDSHRFIIYENNTQGNILAGRAKSVTFKIPEQAVSGDYYIIAECMDLTTGKTTVLSKSYVVSGLQASLITSTGKKVYFEGDLIKAFTDITNLNGLIDNATLNLKVYSSKFLIAPNVSLNYNNLPNRMEINNTFIDAVVVSGSTGSGAIGQSSQTKYKPQAKLESTEQRNKSSTMPRSDGDEGCFTVGTTGGDPENPDDNYKDLMYGHPYPGTSFTTIRIDGNDYRYGSSEGTFVSLPHFEGTSIVSDWIIENVVITQKLTIIYSSTGNPDALEIKYSILNDGGVSKDVGVRVMIDTQLAGNDGAPFTIPDVGNVTKEMDFNGTGIPIYWTTMDSLTNPTVIAHGTLRGVGFDPDKFAIAYWPDIVATTWDYQIDQNQWITSDSAVGIWWDPISITSGESREVATFYGIGYVSEVGGKIIWENSTLLDITDKQNVSNNLTLNATKKLLLLATLFSNSSQIIAQNSTSFYITDKNTSLSLETDKTVYKPNENVSIYGEVTNYADVSKDYNLSVYVNGEEIFSDSFSLGPDQSHTFTTNTRQNNSFILEGEVDGITITDFIKIEYPCVNVNILAPDIVGLEDFNIGILIENIGNIATDLDVSINSTWNITVPEGESRLLETTMSITENTTLTVTISGDVHKTIQKELIFGENARINITLQPTYLEGTVEIPYTITNIGLFDTEFNATFSIDSQTVAQKLFVPKDGNITGSVSFNLTEGAHLLRYTSPFETVNATINVLSPPEFVVTSIYPVDMNFTIGQNVTLVFRVKNIGGSEGEATLTLEMPDYEETNRTWIIAGEEGNISFNSTISDDLEEKSYKGFYVLDGTRDEFTFFVQGANISVDASLLDRSMYAEGDTAALTLELTNECELDLDLYSRVKFNEYDSVQNFTLSGFGTETLIFYVPANFTGDNKILYTVYMASGRALYINSIYLYEEQPDAPLRLFTDKDVYNMGDVVTLHIVDVTRTDVLNLTAPNFSYNDTIGGPTTLEFTLPELRSGTYYIEYAFGNFSSAHPFDVRGYSARILEASLDKEDYISGDEMQLEMNIEANRAVSGLLKILIYDPMADLIDEFAMNKTLEEGENEIEVCRTLSTSVSGIHVIVYGFYTDLSGHSLTLLVSGAEYFDAEAGGLCGDVAPYPDCNGIVDMGDLILLLNNVSYPGDPRYALCNGWAGDCRCTGVRDMGDVILLLNNVSYPEDLRYVLECC